MQNTQSRRRFSRAGMLILLALVLPALWGSDGETEVYTAASGTKYHREGCPSLRQSKIPLSLADAVRQGYEPCSRCNPPVLGDGGGAQDAKGRTAPVIADGAMPGGLGSGGLDRAGGPYRVTEPLANGEILRRSAAADISRMVRAEVSGAVDGDTVKVRIPNPPPGLEPAETIRFLGLDTPETVHPAKPVQHFGKEASAFTQANLLGKAVYLAFDWDLRDRYGRLLAYIYTAPRECFNARLIREGYAHAYTRFPFQFMDEFRALEQEARREQRGLWRSAP